ncbi:hypothetical protein BN970_02104 [Mycolicibacterium conceptionense]|uniref:Uncharacterized protein n=1 Tax=Mycolicibacterium conceptionense TaxID=451644 RepID=A0A0U1D943_9MYCO|nr:hypothetical protein BN970_02104 [Mycolicibacterium conceptionense]
MGHDPRAKNWAGFGNKTAESPVDQIDNKLSDIDSSLG